MQSTQIVSSAELIEKFGCHYHIQKSDLSSILANAKNDIFLDHDVKVVQEIGEIRIPFEEGFFLEAEDIDENFNKAVNQQINNVIEYIEKLKKNSKKNLFLQKIGLLSEAKSESINTKLKLLKHAESNVGKVWKTVYEPVQEQIVIFSECPKVGENYYLIETHPRSKLAITELTVTEVEVEDNRFTRHGESRLDKYDVLINAILTNINGERFHLDCYKILNFNGSYYQDESYSRYFFKTKDEARNFLEGHIRIKQKELDSALNSL